MPEIRLAIPGSVEVDGGSLGFAVGTSLGLGGRGVCADGGKVEANTGPDCSSWTEANEIGGDLSAVFHGDAPGVVKLGEAGLDTCFWSPLCV